MSFETPARPVERPASMARRMLLVTGLGSLLMALLRACDIPCRLHGFTIDKALQKGAITGLAYALAPRNIVHSWVEVELDGQWLELEGFILDADYTPSGVVRIAQLQTRDHYAYIKP